MYLVAGLGITGQSVLRYFEAQGEDCLAFDTREGLDIDSLQTRFPKIEFALGAIPLPWYHQFETLVLSPGISKREPWVVALQKLGKEVIGDIELFARAVGVPVIAITGSNGKSTVTTMTGLALQSAGYQVAIGGNIGEPILDLLMDENEYDVYVLELSSFQLETTYSLNTIAATVLNISEDHMDRYADLEGYIQAKTKVFANSERAILPETFSDSGLIHHALISHFGLSEGFIKSDADYGVIYVDSPQGDQAWLGYGKTPIIAVSDMKLKGRHYQLNALAMMSLCQSFNVSAEHFTHLIKTFNGLPHRTQLVGCYEGVTWINDSKGTNVGATLMAIESIGGQKPGQLILIAGGVGKDANFADLRPAIEGICRHTILFGRDQAMIEDALKGLPLTRVLDLEQAVNLAKSLAVAEECVLFSPACASFDQFENYVQRGEIYTQLVIESYKDSSADHNVAASC
ncbi:MAG: UDP-N-acetylmuramoyl-L-alanine--D-glutamate ligase [Pseudomonadota bacterium]